MRPRLYEDGLAMTRQPHGAAHPRQVRAPSGVVRCLPDDAVDAAEGASAGAEPWRMATTHAGLCGRWVVPMRTATPGALDEWIGWLVRRGEGGRDGSTWILVAETGREGRRYLADLLGHDVGGATGGAAIALLTPDEAALLVENGVGGVGRSGLILVGEAEADSVHAAIRRGDRAAALAHATAVVLREPRRSAAWVATRALATPILDGALATLPGAQLDGRPPTAVGLESRRHRPAMLGVILLAAAGLTAAVAPQHATVVPQAAGSGLRAAPLAPVQTIPRPSTALLAYDSARRQLILVGCCDITAPAETAAITWRWDGATWSVHHDALPPIVTGTGAIVGDPAARSVVLSAVDSGAWTWDGATWSGLSGPASPARGLGVMAYDSAGQTVVEAMGGQTWTWDGTAWQAHSTSGLGVPPEISSAATEPATGHAIVAFASETGDGRLALRRWNGASWTSVGSDTAPSVDFGFQIASDPASGTVVYLGPPVNSFYPDALPETWVWDGRSWARPSVDATPTHSGRLISAFDHAIFVEDAVGGRPPAMWLWTGHGWSKLGADHRFAPSGRVHRGPGPGRT